jgi:peptide subunit release factor 1 (eRF1)
MLAKSIHQLNISRLVLMGTDWQLSFFENYLCHDVKKLIIGHVTNLTNPDKISSKEILEKITPLLEKTEYDEEKYYFDLIYQGFGISGLSDVLEALQIGRLQILLLPWDFDAKAYRCEDELIFGFLDDAKKHCNNPVEINLREYITDLAEEYSTKIEFVKADIKDKLYNEFGGIAGISRW